MRYFSPLRYPGGKARLSEYIMTLITSQQPRPRQYAEPFAGGAGAALQLLYTGVVDNIYLNDLNPGIAAFWRCVTEHSEEFIHLIATCEITIDAWKKHKAVYDNAHAHGDIELGFATFFLNRANRSGILNARPIGGLEQVGKWKIDARFNREGLIKRIKTIENLADRITISELEGTEFLAKIEALGKDVFVYADPPYLVKGEGLYLHAFDAAAHTALADQLSCAAYPWMLTYDDDPRITEDLYSDSRSAHFQIAHTAHIQHIGSESIIYSKDLIVPTLQITKTRKGTWTESI